MDFTLGASYDEMHRPGEAAKAYRAALDDDPDNADTEKALAASLLADGQLDEALVVLKQVVAADPGDVQSTVHISEIQRRQGTLR